jgi:hypothetical protein
LVKPIPQQPGMAGFFFGDQIAATFERFYAEAGPLRLLRSNRSPRR